MNSSDLRSELGLANREGALDGPCIRCDPSSLLSLLFCLYEAFVKQETHFSRLISSM